MKTTDRLKAPYRAVISVIRKRRLKGPKLIQAFTRRYPEAVFVQIGSNDGKKHDPLHRSIMGAAWRGVMVEPVPYVFERLRMNYQHVERVALENVAIAEKSGTKTFYYLKKAGAFKRLWLPRWYDELGSFDKATILKHRDYVWGLEGRLVSTEVRCIDFATLCDLHNIQSPDLLHIDTEGYDYELLKSIDMETRRPKLIIFEHKHLSEADQEESLSYLTDYGYCMFQEVGDTWCVDGRATDPELQAFLNEFHRLTAVDEVAA